MSIHNLKYEVTRYARRGPGKVLDIVTVMHTAYIIIYCIE